MKTQKKNKQKITISKKGKQAAANNANNKRQTANATRRTQK